MELQCSVAQAIKSKAVFLGGVKPGVMRESIEAVAFSRTGRKPKAMYPKAGHGLKVIFETEDLANVFYTPGAFFATMRIKVAPWTVPAEIRVLEWTVGEDATSVVEPRSGTSSPHSESSRDAGTGTVFTARDMHLAFLDIDESIGTLMRRIDVLRIRMGGVTMQALQRTGDSPYGIGVDMNSSPRNRPRRHSRLTLCTVTLSWGGGLPRHRRPRQIQ